MTEPILFVSRWRLRQGERAAFEAMFGQALGLIATTKPRTALFAAYVNEADEEIRIVHAFPDAAAMTDHLEGSQDRSDSVQGVIEFLGFEVYGAAPEVAVDQLRRETASGGGAEFTLFATAIGGYLRSPT